MPRPTRIVYVIDSLRVGGAERQLVRLLARLVRSHRWDPSVYCLDRRGPLIQMVEDLGVEVAGYETPALKRPHVTVRTIAALKAYLVQQDPAIAHCYLPTAGALGTVAARWAGVPHVITTRLTIHAYTGLSLLRYHLVRTVTDHGSDAVIAVCEAARGQALSEGTPPHKIVTIYNAVDAPPIVSRQSDHAPGQLVFGTVGRLHPDKGHRTLIEAAPLVLDALPQARFVLVGDGPERADLEACTAELGIGSRVEFWGTRQHISQILPSFDVFVLPSRREGMPNALLEAMAAGLPSVATRVGGVPEVASHGRTALLVPPAEPVVLARALITLGEDARLREALGHAARANVTSRFSVEREFCETEAVYLRLLNQPAKNAVPSAATRES